MTDLPKFHVKNPTTKEEKLIVELIQQLNRVCRINGSGFRQIIS